MDIELQDGVIEGESVRVEVEAGGGYVSIVMSKSELDAATSRTDKVALIIAAVRELLYSPPPEPVEKVSLAGPAKVDMSTPPPEAVPDPSPA